MAEAEKSIVKTERNNVNLSSFLTAESAFINNFKDSLSLPNLKTLVSLNKRRILKKRPSKSTNCFK